MLRNSQATGVVLGAAILALPLLAALIRFFNLPEKDKLRSRPWVQYCQLHRVLRLVVVIAWCALYEWSPMLESVFWGLPTIATFVGTAEVVLMTRSVLELKWTQFDLFRLAVWGTASLAVATSNDGARVSRRSESQAFGMCLVDCCRCSRRCRHCPFACCTRIQTAES